VPDPPIGTHVVNVVNVVPSAAGGIEGYRSTGAIGLFTVYRCSDEERLPLPGTNTALTWKLGARPAAARRMT
jgi:hypothetical protein